MSLSAPATVQMVQNVIEGVTPAYGLATDAQVNALFAPPASLQDADAATIAMLSENGTIQNYYSVGDEKTITLSTGEQVTFVILGFDHDDLSDGSGKAGVFPNMMVGGLQVTYEELDDGTYNLVFTTNQD